jgi:hypothetical protein
MSISFNPDAKGTSQIEAFGKGEPVQGLLFVEGQDSAKRTQRFKLQVECLGPITVSDYGHSVLCKLVSADDLTTFESIEDTAAELAGEKMDFKQFVKDNKFFMKLPHKNDKYRAIIEPSCTPSQADKSGFQQGAQLDIEFAASTWMNFESATAGLFLNVFKIVIDGGKKKLNRKK